MKAARRKAGRDTAGVTVELGPGIARQRQRHSGIVQTLKNIEFGLMTEF